MTKTEFKNKYKIILEKYLKGLRKIAMSLEIERVAAATISMDLKRRKKLLKKEAEALVTAFEEVHKQYCTEYLRLLIASSELQDADKKVEVQVQLERVKEVEYFLKIFRLKSDYFLGKLDEGSALVHNLRAIKSLTLIKWVKLCLRGDELTFWAE